VPETTASSRSLRSLPESDQAVRNKTPGRSRLDVRGSSLPARLYRYPTSRSSVVEHVDRILKFASRPPSIRALLGWTPYSLLGSSWGRLRYAISYRFLREA